MKIDLYNAHMIKPLTKATSEMLKLEHSFLPPCKIFLDIYLRE